MTYITIPSFFPTIWHQSHQFILSLYLDVWNIILPRFLYYCVILILYCLLGPIPNFYQCWFFYLGSLLGWNNPILCFLYYCVVPIYNCLVGPIPNFYQCWFFCLGSLLGWNYHFVFLMCLVHVLFCVCNLVCSVLVWVCVCVILCFFFLCIIVLLPRRYINPDIDLIRQQSALPSWFKRTGGRTDGQNYCKSRALLLIVRSYKVLRIIT
jgi:hypothetical protein